LSTAGAVRLSLAYLVPGRLAGTKCAPPTRANQTKRHCTRTVVVRTLTIPGNAGTNTIALAGVLLHGTPPPIGHYRLAATPTSASATNGTARTTFRIVK
jgi:hypothetical protein